MEAGFSLIKRKNHLHFVSSPGGSIWEITSDLLPFLEKEFIVTKDWNSEIPSKNEILLCHFLKPQMFLTPDFFDSFETKVLIQPIDGTVLKKEIIDMINCFDIVFTPGDAGKSIMEKNGVKVPIIIIPNYYKKDLFEKQIWSEIENYIPKNKVIFYHESTFHPRKGIEILYEGFTRAFADTKMANEVILIVKDLPYTSFSFKKNEELKLQTIKLQKTFINPPKIYKFSAFLNENELKTLWNIANVYVSFAKIEGFGIPMLRMFLMNKPIIALNNENSGYIDYLNNSNSYLIDCLNTTAYDEFMWLYENETEWAIPNMSDVMETFVTCYDDLKNNSAKRMKNDYHTMGMDWVEYFDKYSLNTVSNCYINFIKEIHRENLSNKA